MVGNEKIGEGRHNLLTNGGYMKKDEEQKLLEFWEGYFAKQRGVELNTDDKAFIDKLLEKVTESVTNLEGTDNIYKIGKMVEFDWKQRKLIYQGDFPPSSFPFSLFLTLFFRDTKTIFKNCDRKTTN
jgi:hypothetical protein